MHQNVLRPPVTPPPATLLLAAALAVLCADRASAQFVNRATWLGSEEEGIRRNFPQGSEYFLDRASYVLLAPWWNPGLERFASGANWRVGSTSSTQFTVEGALDLHQPLGDGFGFRYHVLQSEHRDARFLRNEVALEYALGAESAVFAQGSLFADKSLIDVSLGAWLWRRDDDALRVMLTAVDWTNEKSRAVEYEREPYAAMLSGAFGDRNGVRVAFELGAQLPLEVRELENDDRLELSRYLGDVQLHWRLRPTDVLVAAVEAETTAKELTPLAGDDPRQERFDRTFWQLRAEWWRDAAMPWSVGVLHTFHDEVGRRDNARADDLRTDRREWFGLARLRWVIDDRLSFEPHLFAGYVQDEFRDGGERRDRDRFEGKLGWNTRWDFSPAASLVVIVTTQLDEPAFGGGGAQFVARF